MENTTKARDVIIIFETKLNDFSFSYSSPRCKFVNNNSKTKAWGVGIYIKSMYSFNIRHNLNLNVGHCEDIWIKVTLKNNCTCIFGAINRHPQFDIKDFLNKLKKRVISFNKKKEKIFFAVILTLPHLKLLTKK